MNDVRHYVRELWRDTLCLLLLLAGIGLFLSGHFEWAALCWLNGWTLDGHTKRPRLKPNQAIITAAVEPSSDMRQAAHALMEYRAALIGAGLTSKQAAELIAATIASQNGETS